MHGFGHCIGLSALSSLKFLLTFPSQEEMEAALSNLVELHQLFEFIKKWDIAECCDSRRVWIDILGVPPQGWKWENFKLIAELWGQLICLGKSTTCTDSFKAMRALITTDRFCRIDSEILLLVDNYGYRVTIREIETVCQAVWKPFQNAHHIRMEDKDSNIDSNSEVPGFEDLQEQTSNQGQSVDQESPMNQARQNSISNSNSAEVKRSPGINVSGRKVVESPRIRSVNKINSHSGNGKQSPRVNESSPHEVFGSRTK